MQNPNSAYLSSDWLLYELTLHKPLLISTWWLKAFLSTTWGSSGFPQSVPTLLCSFFSPPSPTLRTKYARLHPQHFRFSLRRQTSFFSVFLWAALIVQALGQVLHPQVIIFLATKSPWLFLPKSYLLTKKAIEFLFCILFVYNALHFNDPSVCLALDFDHRNVKMPYSSLCS